MSANSNLHKAKTEKNDEFYTQLTDVAKELMHYKEHFKGKTVFCNCDDPTWSAFWKYFHLNFEQLGLKKLISTHYDRYEPTYKMEYEGGNDNDIEVGVKTPLEGNGDFRNQECLDLLDEADIVVTNPPFSLFREYVAVLMEHEKKFLILGNKNAATNDKDIFPLFYQNECWFGFNSPAEFNTPDGVTKKVNGLTRWFTNLDITKRHEKLITWRTYNPDEYPKFDNFDAINVNKTTDIPYDYYEPMGVPITFMDKYNPDQFEILGVLNASTDEQAGLPNLRYYNDFKEVKPDGSYTGSSGGKANGNAVMRGKAPKGNYFYNPATGEYIHSLYSRLIIRRKVGA